MSMRRLFRSLLLAAAIVPLSAFAAAHAQQGTVTGRVTDAGTGQPISAVMVSVVGTNVGGQTNADGRYTLRGVNPGTVTLRALRIGFAGDAKLNDRVKADDVIFVREALF